jgi:hypothetical protein
MFVVALTVLYISIVISVFIPVAILGTRSEFLNFYSNIHLFVPLAGGIFGLVQAARSARGAADSRRSAVTIYSLAMVSWALGSILWVGGNLGGVAVPYPGWPEIGYLGAGLLLIYGTWYVVRRVADVQRSWPGMLLGAVVGVAIVIPIILLPRQWRLGHPDDPVKFVFDLGYPLCDATSLGMAILLVRQPRFRMLGPLLRRSLWLLFVALALLFIADLGFGVITTLSEDHPRYYYNGNWSDFVFCTAFWLLGAGVLFMPLEDDNTGSSINRA